MEIPDPQSRSKLIVLVIVGLAYSLSIAYFFSTLSSQQCTDDFFPRWHASKQLLLTGRSLYDWQNAVEVSACSGWPLLHQLGYYYPAYLLIFTAPLSLLTMDMARIIWTIFGLWSLWLSIFIIARRFQPTLSVNRLTLLLVLTTLSVPAFQHTLNAQFNHLGVLALALTYWALYRGKYGQAGFWAGGLLFKPQATLLTLLCLLLWSGLNPTRRRFWLGLGGISLLLWSIAEIFESNWVFHFLGALGNYEPTRSVVDTIWNPYQLIALILVGLTVWFTVRLRAASPRSASFAGLMAWSLGVNALIVPLFGMLHMVLIGLAWAILLNGFHQLDFILSRWLWAGMIGLFIAGLLAFLSPLFLVGVGGLQITLAEIVYKTTMPIVTSLASLLLIFASPPSRPVQATANAAL